MAGERFIKGKIVKGDLIGTSIVIGPLPFPPRPAPCDTVMFTDLCNPVVIELEEGRRAILATCDTAAITSGCGVQPGPPPLNPLAGLAVGRRAAAARRGPATKGTKGSAARKKAKTK